MASKLFNPPTVFGLGEDRAVLRAALQNHTRSEQVRAALQLDAGLSAEVCHTVCSAHYFHCGTVTFPLVPEKLRMKRCSSLHTTLGSPIKVFTMPIRHVTKLLQRTSSHSKATQMLSLLTFTSTCTSSLFLIQHVF